MATEDNWTSVPQPSFDDMFDNQTLDNLDELFDFLQCDASFFATWDPLELVAGGGGLEEQIEPPMHDMDNLDFDVQINGATTAETDPQGSDLVTPSSADPFPNPRFLNETNPPPTVFRQFTNDPPKDSIMDINDFFNPPSTSNEFFGFGDGWSQQSTQAFPDFPIPGGSATNAVYMTPTAIFSPSIFDLTPSTQIPSVQFPLQRFTELPDEEPIMEGAAHSQEPQIPLQSSRPEIPFRRTEETMISTLPKKRYAPACQTLLK